MSRRAADAGAPAGGALIVWSVACFLLPLAAGIGGAVLGGRGGSPGLAVLGAVGGFAITAGAVAVVERLRRGRRKLAQ